MILETCINTLASFLFCYGAKLFFLCQAVEQARVPKLHQQYHLPSRAIKLGWMTSNPYRQSSGELRHELTHLRPGTKYRNLAAGMDMWWHVQEYNVGM